MAETLKFSVSELTELIKNTLESLFYGLTVEGEISGFKYATTGHWYFSLKDRDAVINAAMWRTNAVRAGFVPKDGQRVIVTGSISVYPPRGTYQITCTSIRLAGQGDILAMLEERKKRYNAMGYFDQSLKKPIPKRPERVAVITSATGAALQDILQVTGRRNAGMDIVILPAQVQGSGAAEEIAARIREVNLYALAPVMIVGRGGGSVEDLLAFSEDVVIQAIHDSQIPVISAVGHEIDWAISDFVADLRAPTPSAAAELVCSSGSEQAEKLAALKLSMLEAVSGKARTVRLRFAAVNTKASARLIENRIGNARLTLDSGVEGVRNAVRTLMKGASHALDVHKRMLGALNPSAVLDRGYAIVSTQEGRTVKALGDVEDGQRLSVRVSGGRFAARVENSVENSVKKTTENKD